MARPFKNNVFEYLRRKRSCHGFQPVTGNPTPVLPGSAAKILVLAKRLAAGEELFHDLDASFLTMPDDIDVPRRSIHLALCHRIRLRRKRRQAKAPDSASANASSGRSSS